MPVSDGQNTANYLSQQRHHIEVIMDKAKLNVRLRTG